MHGKQLLDALEELGAYIRDEHINLVSKRHSDSYINVRTALSFQNYALEISKELAAEFQEDKIRVVVGFTKSGNILAQIIAEHLHAKAVIIDILDSNFSYLTSDKILKGENILIIDDVLTTGKSIYKALNILSDKTKGKIVGIGIVVDRSTKKIDFGVKYKRLAKINMNLWRSGKKYCPKCQEDIKIIDLSKPLPISIHKRR
jgi:orotate phosphoribosyltransferase